MADVKVYDQDKKEVGTISLSSEVFDVKIRPEILHFVVRAQQAAKRSGCHLAKTRAFVSGGGNKPWKQKGTGRARSGSNRSPIWRGGAVIFGPQLRDYSFKVNRKVRALAMKMALSSRLVDQNLLVLKEIVLPELKTKNFAKIVANLGLDTALFVVPSSDVSWERCTRNIQGITVTTPDKLSVLEILRHKSLVLLEGSVLLIHERFAVKGA